MYYAEIFALFLWARKRIFCMKDNTLTKVFPNILKLMAPVGEAMRPKGLRCESLKF